MDVQQFLYLEQFLNVFQADWENSKVYVKEKKTITQSIITTDKTSENTHTFISSDVSSKLTSTPDKVTSSLARPFLAKLNKI